MSEKQRFGRIRRFMSGSKDYGRKVVNAEQIQQEWGDIRDMASDVLRPKDKSARVETFENAVSRMKLSEADLASSYRFHSFRAYLFLGSLGLGLILVLAFAIAGQWGSSIACIGFSIGMAALAFQASFRSLQIRRRELVPVRFWLDHPGEWVPKSLTLPPLSRKKSSLPVKSNTSSKR